MAEARTQGSILGLAVACLLGLSAPVVGEVPVLVEQRLVPPSPMAELGESDIVRATAMIRDLGSTFGALAGREGTDRTRWTIYQRTYHGAATRLDTMLADGQITVRDLPQRQAAAIIDGGIVLDTTLAGRWQPGAIRTRRKLGTGDWEDISRLAGDLVAQLALDNFAGGWDAWLAAHDRATNAQDLVGEPPDELLRPLLVRFWHIQDKYLASAVAEAGGIAPEANRTAALSNDMLAVLKQVESAAGWRWRKSLETVWDERDDQARAIARVVPVAEVVESAGVETEAEPVVEQPSPPAQLADQTPGEVEPPDSAGFDELFANREPAPLVIAAGPAEDTMLRADIGALSRENSARAVESQDLGARLNDLSGQVEALAANVAEQGRQLETVAEGIAVTKTVPAALAMLTASQAALEKRLADIANEIGPNGLSSQLAALKAAMDSEQSRSREAEQRLETRVQERLRSLSRDVDVARGEVAELQSGLSAFRPSATAIEVPLQDVAARRIAFRQAVVAGVALFVLLVAAIAFWVRGARQRTAEADWSEYEALGQDVPNAQDVQAAARPDAGQSEDGEGLSALMAGLYSIDENALRDELTQLRQDIESERGRAGDLERRLKQVTAQLGESQVRAKRLVADLAAVRADTQIVGRGLLDGAARDEAIGNELIGLRQAVEVERERAKRLQSLVDELKSSVAMAQAAQAAQAAQGRDDEVALAPGGAPAVAPATADHAALQRAIEALHRSDLPGFEQAFAELAALPLPAVEGIVRHEGAQDLALACRAVGIAKPHLAAILILSRRAGPGERHLAPRDLAEAMTAYDETSAEAAEKILQDWRIRVHGADGVRATELT